MRLEENGARKPGKSAAVASRVRWSVAQAGLRSAVLKRKLALGGGRGQGADGWRANLRLVVSGPKNTQRKWRLST